MLLLLQEFPSEVSTKTLPLKFWSLRWVILGYHSFQVQSLWLHLQRKKRKESDHPSIPHDWDDMKIPEDMKCTADGQNFCIMEERMPGKDQKIWGFASQMGIEVMKTATDWFIDGTFELVNSTLFKQLWVVMDKITKVNI